MKKPEQIGDKIISCNWQELATSVRRNEAYINYMEQKGIKKLIVMAHYNLTTKMGRPEYSPDAFEIQQEVDKLLNPRGCKRGS